MQNGTIQATDLTRGQNFLGNAAAVQAYRMQHGSNALMPFMGDGGQFLARHCDDRQVNLISCRDFSEKVVSRVDFDKGYFIVILDEMPLYLNPSDEMLAEYNNQIEAYARAASLCA